MNVLAVLADPVYVSKFQKLCGVEIVKPVTCDQQTQTGRQSPDSEDGDDQHTCATVGTKDFSHSAGDGGIDQELRGPGGHGDDCGPNGRSQVRHGLNSGLISGQCESYNNNNNSNNNNNNIHGHRGPHSEINGDTELMNGTKSMKSCRLKSITKDIQDCRIIEPSSRAKGNIVVCNGHSGRISAQFINSNSSACDTAQTTPSAYRIKYRSLYYLARFGAFLGNEEFYLTFFPFCLWNLDSLVVRQVTMLWGIVMYLGQATKDYFQWPRPPCPPVIRLETHYIQEYSMPSTHAMAGTAIPLYFAVLAVERYQVPVPVAVGVGLLWFSITCMSRLYLGVHTILDLVAGFFYAICIFFTFIRYVGTYDLYMQTHPFAAPVLLTTALTLCTVCYPSSYKNSSKGDAVQIVAAVAGCNIGFWLSFQMGIMQAPLVAKPYLIEMPSLHWCGLAMLRFVSGVAIVAVIYIGVKLSSIRLFSYLYGLDVPDKSHPSVITAYKFTTYTCIGAVIALLIPLVHVYLGIDRPAMFHEIL